MRYALWFTVLLLSLASCNKTKIEDIYVPPIDSSSNGNTMQVNGIVGSEQGSAAGNSVFIDFSKDKQRTLTRAGWDLAFYCGSDFRVLINNTTAAMAKVTNKTDINAVNSSDVAGVSFELDIANPSPEAFAMIDDIDGDLTKTAIPVVSSTEAENKVIVIHRGTAGSVAARDLIKIRVQRNVSGGYTLQYAPIDATTFNTIEIAKDEDYNFKYWFFEQGVVSGEPKKSDWDIMWTMAIYKTPLGNDFVAYVFSDLVAINYLNGTMAVEKEYATAAEATTAFNNYTRAMAEAETFVSERWKIGSRWRKTAAPSVTDPGVIKTRFYIVKDSQGNYYRLKFLSFTSEDGGERGRPELRYELLQ
ncbi:HmuY family protein [Edaphocola flava]|uniref:HmuY family protein n=1 Tax=Edaphocola flava TaxID=2499629 RepID=UPI00100AAE91|nr:HmuY family protein [Edaphocola flava]